MTKILKRVPFPGLSDLHNVLDKIFEPNWFENNWVTRSMSSNWVPTIDVKEDKEHYIIRADIPGVDPKNIEVSIENGVLMIKGHKETETKEEKENFLHVERSSGSFYRSLPLPNAADARHVRAKTKNGVLEISVPKIEEDSTSRIKIEAD